MCLVLGIFILGFHISFKVTVSSESFPGWEFPQKNGDCWSELEGNRFSNSILVEFKQINSSYGCPFPT